MTPQIEQARKVLEGVEKEIKLFLEIFSESREEIINKNDFKFSAEQLESLYLALRVLGRVDSLMTEIKTWNCDNVNCGKGAMCNFCALKQKLHSLIAEEK